MCARLHIKEDLNVLDAGLVACDATRNGRNGKRKANDPCCRTGGTAYALAFGWRRCRHGARHNFCYRNSGLKGTRGARAMDLFPSDRGNCGKTPILMSKAAKSNLPHSRRDLALLVAYRLKVDGRGVHAGVSQPALHKI